MFLGSSSLSDKFIPFYLRFPIDEPTKYITSSTISSYLPTFLWGFFLISLYSYFCIYNKRYNLYNIEPPFELESLSESTHWGHWCHGGLCHRPLLRSRSGCLEHTRTRNSSGVECGKCGKLMHPKWFVHICPVIPVLVTYTARIDWLSTFQGRTNLSRRNKHVSEHIEWGHIEHK